AASDRAARARPPAPAGVDLAEPRGSAVALEALGHDLALVDPHLDADPPERRLGLGEAVVDIGAQRVERHAPLAVLLRPGHLRPAEPAAAAHLHALGTRPHRGAER